MPSIREEKQPIVQLVLLGIYLSAGLFAGALAGFVLAVLMYGMQLFKDLSWVSGNDPAYAGALKIILVGQSIGMFLLPALALSLTEGIKIRIFYGLKAPKPNLMLVILLLLICALPLLSLITEANAAMHLPGSLKAVEVWMRAKEDEALIITKAILTTNSPWVMLVNLFVIAIVPAICEEFLFRGALQRILNRMFKNPHVAIWVTAIVFSSIHFQFFGFFPRLLLGAMFGYIYFWTGSLWYPVLAHFLNNGYAVVIAFILHRNHQPIDQADEINVNWIVYTISAVLTLLLLKYLKDRSAFSAKHPTPNT